MTVRRVRKLVAWALAVLVLALLVVGALAVAGVSVGPPGVVA